MQAKFCSKCGTPIDEGHKFCRKCGTPVKSMAAPSQQMPAAGRPAPDIPSYQEIEARLNSAGAGRNEPSDYNPEGTVLLGGPGSVSSAPSAYGNVKRKAEIRLSFEDMLRGCSKVVDFGTGTKFELAIPAGLSPGDKIEVRNTGITDPDTGRECSIELTAVIG